MRAFSRLAVLALTLLGRAACEEPQVPSEEHKISPSAIYTSANEAFQDLLNALPEESLHVALNSLNQFRKGIFESDRSGVEHVHQEDPPLATRLIVAAVQDLRKRQVPAGSNSTATSSQPPPESSTTNNPPASKTESESTAATSTSKAVVVPVDVTTTDSQGRTTVQSTNALGEASASVAVPVTTTNSKGEQEVTTQTKPAVVLSTTDSAGRPLITTSEVSFAPTYSQVLTETDESGRTFLTTYTPSGGQVRSIVLKTTTGADGKPTVITSYTHVNPAAATSTGPSGTKKPSLQSGAAVKNKAIDAAMIGGALGGFAFLI